MLSTVWAAEVNCGLSSTHSLVVSGPATGEGPGDEASDAPDKSHDGTKYSHPAAPGVSRSALQIVREAGKGCFPLEKELAKNYQRIDYVGRNQGIERCEA